MLLFPIILLIFPLTVVSGEMAAFQKDTIKTKLEKSTRKNQKTEWSPSDPMGSLPFQTGDAALGSNSNQVGGVGQLQQDQQDAG